MPITKCFKTVHYFLSHASCRTKAVFFVFIIYNWNFEQNKLSCILHTCITPDLSKSNEQFTKFIDTVFQLYSKCYRNGKHGQIRLLLLWSDNCIEQFKNTIFCNYFASGHGKGIWDSSGGINKKCCCVCTCGVALIITLPWKLYQYLSQHVQNSSCSSQPG